MKKGATAGLVTLAALASFQTMSGQGWPTAGVRVRLGLWGGERIVGRLRIEPRDTFELDGPDGAFLGRWARGDVRTVETYDGFGPDLGKGFGRGALVGAGLGLGLWALSGRNSTGEVPPRVVFGLWTAGLSVVGGVTGLVISSGSRQERWRPVERRWWPVVAPTPGPGLAVGLRITWN